ncbi:hypothetical protein D3C87_1672170 [compost metagenome]
MVVKLPRDLDIFSPPTATKPLCSQKRAKVCSVRASDWATSFSWCGKSRSVPPVWMSMVSPRCLRTMAEHSMCQPGRPGPQGESQEGSPGLEAFQRAKSMGWRFFSSISTRAPACIWSSVRPESWP